MPTRIRFLSPQSLNLSTVEVLGLLGADTRREFSSSIRLHYAVNFFDSSATMVRVSKVSSSVNEEKLV